MNLMVIILISLLLLQFSGTSHKENTFFVSGSLAMRHLYEDLFTDYNRLILPVANTNKNKVNVTIGLKLGQILDLNLKQQILSTNVWVEQTWHDHRLEWDPRAYENIDMIHVPAENIWIPDIVLFNNADGNYELTLIAKAVLYSSGKVVWKPPTMFRSTCEIDVEYFPFDIQTCFLRFGSWTYAGDEVAIQHVGSSSSDTNQQTNAKKVDIGIDLSQFYKNVEWDIIDVPAYYNENRYIAANNSGIVDGQVANVSYPDITFKIVIRRKMLFYLVNLILPVALMTFMTVSVFYLPADSNEKVTLSISILTSLIVFFLLMLEVIPPTSLAVPLFGKYLLFTLVLVSLSACVSVYVLNIYHRAPSVHKMSPRYRYIFLKLLPRLLFLDRPDPRERSSLNRFRKKKIAQQILQARQHHKVYDLAQPLAASLNLIETLQKSYDSFNRNEDDLGKKRAAATLGDGFSQSDDGEEEGRYFRRYVDHYIGRLDNKSCNHQQQANKFRRNNNLHKQASTSSSSARTMTTMTINNNQNKLGSGLLVSSSNRCYSDHQKCCSMANKPIQSKSSLRSTGTGIRVPTANTAFCGGPNYGLDPTMTTSFTTNQHHVINDDTFDMTFDYDDQVDNGSGPMVAPVSCNVDNASELLPSPPPPPRQLTQLSDSMKDLSGRLSSSSQKMLGASGAIQRANDDEDDELDLDDDGSHLVDKLISSINLINNSNDMETPTTTSVSNNDEEFLHFKAMTQSLNSGGGDGGSGGPTLPMMQQQQSAASQHCTCSQPVPPEVLTSPSPLDHPTSQQQECRYRGPTQQREHLQHQQQPYVPESQAGTGIPTTNLQEQPSELLLSLRLPYHEMPDHVRAAIRSILFIADSIKNEDDENSATEDWESMSMVVDRLFLWMFLILCTVGSFIILALAPSLSDHRESIDDKLRMELPASNCSAFDP